MKGPPFVFLIGTLIYKKTIKRCIFRYYFNEMSGKKGIMY